MWTVTLRRHAGAGLQREERSRWRGDRIPAERIDPRLAQGPQPPDGGQRRPPGGRESLFWSLPEHLPLTKPAGGGRGGGSAVRSLDKGISSPVSPLCGHTGCGWLLGARGPCALPRAAPRAGEAGGGTAPPWGAPAEPGEKPRRRAAGPTRLAPGGSLMPRRPPPRPPASLLRLSPAWERLPASTATARRDPRRWAVWLGFHAF